MVSVIVPYNKDRGTLKRCIESIEDQTYPDIELIESFGPGTVGENFNNGLDAASGEFCKFVCEDDWLPTTSIADLVEGMGAYYWICANSINHNERPWIEYSTVKTLEEMIVKNPIHGGSTLYRTDVLREIGGMDETLVTGEEYDMHLKLVSLGYTYGYIDKVVYNHRIWPKQKSLIMRHTDREWRDEQLNKIRARYDKRNSTL